MIHERMCVQSTTVCGRGIPREVTADEPTVFHKWLEEEKSIQKKRLSLPSSYSATQRMLNDNHWNNNIHVLGVIRGKDKIAEMFQASDLYVLPSYREGLPLTMFEAFASGLPIVASPVNGIPYEMKEPENGLFVKYGDIEGLKKAMLKILDDEKFSMQIRKNNIEKAKAYDWDIIAERNLKVYESLLNK